MAINPETQYPGKIAPSDSEYPYGKARNITVPGDGTGTPWEAALVNDLFGFQQAALTQADIVPSGTPEKATSSQYLEALARLFNGAPLFDSVDDLVAGLQSGGASTNFAKLAARRATVQTTAYYGGWTAELKGPEGGGFYVIMTDTDYGAAPDGRIDFYVGGGTDYVAKLVIEDTILVTQAGARGDGTTDDTLAIQAAINTRAFVEFPAKRVFVAANLDSVAGGGIFCPNGRATIAVTAGAGNHGITINTSDFHLNGIDFSGGNLGPWNDNVLPFGDRDGIIVGNTVGTGVQLNNITIYNSDVYGFDRFGIIGREVQVGFIFGKRVAYHNVNCYKNYVGLAIGERHEYCTFSQVYAWECNEGLQQTGGNNMWVASTFTWCYKNAVLATGENDGHGTFSACNFNHSATTTPGNLGLECNNIEVGEVFDGCMFWFADIVLNNCRGISIRNSHIATSSSITIDGGEVNHIDDNYTHGGPLNITQSGFTFTKFRRNFEYSKLSTSQNAFWGDLFIYSNESTFPYPIVWNTPADVVIPFTNMVRKYNSVDQSFVHDGSTGTVSQSDNYLVNMNVRFDVGATAEHVTLKLRVFGPNANEYVVSGYFPANTTDCGLLLSQQLFMTTGDTYDITLKCASGNPITIPVDGLDFTVKSLDN